MRKVHARFAEFRWAIRVVWSSPAMFLTSATCHLFEKRWRESVITAVAVSHGACRHRLHFAENPQFCTFTSPSILRSSISHFAFCFIPTPTTRWVSKKNQSLTPAALEGSNLDGSCTNPYGKKGQCILFLFYSLWYFVLSYDILIVIKFILFY